MRASIWCKQVMLILIKPPDVSIPLQAIDVLNYERNQNLIDDIEIDSRFGGNNVRKKY
jgi:hypothetical protein